MQLPLVSRGKCRHQLEQNVTISEPFTSTEKRLIIIHTTLTLILYLLQWSEVNQNSLGKLIKWKRKWCEGQPVLRITGYDYPAILGYAPFMGFQLLYISREAQISHAFGLTHSFFDRISGSGRITVLGFRDIVESEASTRGNVLKR